MGLAHLLEHMLFLGSEQFPEPNGINQFISQQGGNINAWTGTEFTSFHFDIHQSGLQEALERFIDMFISPLLLPTMVEKEIEAIDAEFLLKQKDDLRCLYQVHKETCNPAHPFSQFSVGNKQTFSPFSAGQLADKLREFHHQRYVAHNLCLCVISPFSEEEISQWLLPLLSRFSSLEPTNSLSFPPLYLTSQLGVRIDIQPIMAARRLILTFALPGMDQYYRAKPTHLISHILGDEGEGSLLQYLKGQNWVTNLSAGGGISGTNFKDFNVNMQLTELGTEHVDDIIEAVFYNLKLIKTEGLELWRLEEKQALLNLARDFSDQGKLLDEANHLSGNMFSYPIEHVCVADFMLDQPDIELIKAVLDHFSPQNMRIKYINQAVETTTQAQFYHTPYKVSEISESQLQGYKKPAVIEQITLPKRNPYITQETRLQPKNNQYAHPVKLIEEPNMGFWFGQDHKFNQPKGDCFISFDCDAVTSGIEAVTYKRLWVALIQESLVKTYYRAGIAGLNYHIYPHQGGFSLHTNGFSQQQLAFCSELFEQIHTLDNFSEYFEQVRHKQWQALQNSLLNKPINRLFTRLSVLMQRHAHAHSDMVGLLDHATLDHVSSVKERLLNKYHLEVLVHGDWSPESATAFGHQLHSHMQGFPAAGKLSRDVADIRSGHFHLHQVSSHHSDSAIAIYLQGATASDKDTALMILMEQLLSGPFFNELRTNRQLGYLVGTGYVPFNQHPGMVLYIQSPTAPIETLFKEITGFIESHSKSLLNAQNYFEQVKQGVIKQLREKDTNLSMKSQRLWVALGTSEGADFQREKRLIAALNAISFEQICRFSASLLRSPNIGKLALFANGKFAPFNLGNATQIEDITAFKAQVGYIK